jgi:hypothetical protein
MEKFFSPTRQLREIWEDATQYRDMDDPFEHYEVQLLVPVEEFLIIRWDWEDLCAFANRDVLDKILWIIEDTTFIAVSNLSKNVTDDAAFMYVVSANFTVASGQVHTLTLFNESDSAVSTGACSVFWRAIETSNCVTLCIENMMTEGESFPSGPILAQFLRESPSLQVLKFEGFHFGEGHCRAFATMQRTDLKITFSGCTLEPLEADGAFIEWFRHSQVVTELHDSWMLGSCILSALSGNSSVKRLSLEEIGQCSAERIHGLSQLLATNKNIEYLRLKEFKMSDEVCRLFFRSLSTHPRIKALCIWNADSPKVESTMMNAIIKMLYLNTVVLTIELPYGAPNEEVYRNSILPRLEMNRNCFEVQRQAMKRADPSIRPQLLGRVLHMVRYNPDLVFRFLSENVPAFVRTEEEEGDYATPLENDPNLVSGLKRKASS